MSTDEAGEVTVGKTYPGRMAAEQLAIFTAEPAFRDPLHVGRPNIGERSALFSRISDMLDRGWLTNGGPFVEEFEQRVASIVGVEHVVAMCNATVALEIATRALGLSGEVIVPSFTFVATAHCLQWQQITPVFCDVDPETHNLDPSRLEALITPRTSGIIGVHLWGRACDVAGIAEVAERRGLQLMFDAAHAFGCSDGDRMIGSNGAAEVFSFHATKFVSCGEGGAVATNDGQLAERMRLMRNFGFADFDRVIYVGTNGKMSEAAAAMGLTSIDQMDRFLSQNAQNYEAYSAGLAGLPGLRLIEYGTADRSNKQYIVVEIDESQTGLSRDQLLQILRAENVLARRYFYPGCHRMEPYRSYFPHAGMLLPVTERLTERVLTLPTGLSVGPNEIETVCSILRVAIGASSEIRSLLQQ